MSPATKPSTTQQSRAQCARLQSAHCELRHQLQVLAHTLDQITCYGEVCSDMGGFCTLGRLCAHLQQDLAGHIRDEEDVFRRLKAQRRDMGPLLAGLTGEHRALQRSLSILVLALKALTTGQPLMLDVFELQDQLQSLIRTLDRHIEAENSQVLPLLEAA